MYGGMEVKLHVVVTSALDGCDWSASRSIHFTSTVKSRRYPFDRRLGGPQTRSGSGC